jgi:hypothetical protein
MSDKAALTELVREGGEFVVRDISGGAKARYVRIYFASFYRFADVTEVVMGALDLPLVRAEGMHTAAIWATDAELVARIAEAVRNQPPGEPAAPPAAPEGPSGGKRVRAKRPSPSRPPRGGAAVPTK